MADKIRLDADHRYWLGDKEVPGYSHIVKSLGVVEDSPFWTEEGREAGTALHAWLLHLAQGKPEVSKPDPRIAGKVEGIRKFLRESGFKLAFGEVAQYEPVLRYACTPDLCGTLGMFSVNIDMKAGAKQKSHPLQLAAQKIALCYHPFRVQKSFSLYLKEGDYRLVEQDTRTHEANWRIFMAAYHSRGEYK